MPITQVDIANEALDLVGASTILSLNDPTPEARIVSRQLWATIDRVLQSYPFTCALKTVRLDARAANPVLTDQVYPLPEDCLRTYQVDAESWQQEQVDGHRCLKVRQAGAGTGAQTETETGTEADTAPGALSVTYIARITDVNQLDPLVRELIALELAIKIAASLTESPQRISALTRKAIHARKLAQMTDARQQSIVPLTMTSAPSFWSQEIGG